MTKQYGDTNINDPRRSRNFSASGQLNLDEDLVVADSSGGAITLTLPNAEALSGRQLTVKAPFASANPVTVDTVNSQTIDGFLTNVLTINNQFLTVKSDGSNWRIISSGTGTTGTSSLDWKESCRVATTGPGTLATDFENGDTIDGVVLATGDRILIKDQAAGAENGIYIVQASGAPIRSPDADTSAEVTSGMTTYISEGTANGGEIWILVTVDPIVLGVTPLVFAQLSAGAPANLSYVVAVAEVGLSAERVLTGSAGDISVTDNGPNSTIVVDLINTAVTPGSYNAAKITVDANGRLTAAAEGLTAVLPTNSDAGAASVGVSSDASRADHKHQVDVGNPVSIGTSNLPGSSNDLIRADHTHDHSSLPGGSLHALATPTVAGFMSAADKTKLDGLTSDTPRQEGITTQNITVDTTMTDTLDFQPTSPASVLIMLNGIPQEQGAGLDYILTGGTNQSIRWLAGSGTAVDMATTDTMFAYYES